MKKFKKVLIGIFEAILIIYVLFFTTFLMCKNKFGYTQFGDKTLIIVDKENKKNLGSFQEGDLVIIEKVSYDDIKKGDEIYFYDTINNEYVIKRNIVTDKSGEKGAFLVNIGEKRTISGERMLGTFQKQSYDGVGKIVGFLTSRFGFLVFVILPIMLLFIYQIYTLIFLVKGDGDKDEPAKKKVVKKDPKEIEEIETL